MKKPKTNADRIRQMTDDELVEFMAKLEEQDIDFGKTFCGWECDQAQECDDCRKWWLQLPYSENGYWSSGIRKADNF